MVNPDRRVAGQLAARARLVQMAGARRARKMPSREGAPVHLADAFDEALTKLLEPLAEVVTKIVEPAIPLLVSVAPLPRSDARFDAPSDDVIRRVIRDVEIAIGRQVPMAEIERLARDIGLQVSDHNRRAISRQFRQVLGIDFLTSEPHLADQLDLFRSTVTALITRVTDEEKRKVEDVLHRAARTGSRVEEIRDRVRETLGVSQSRASLIARDQVLKLNGELTQLRHREAGVEEYAWSCSEDQRVRGRPDGLWPKGNHWQLDTTRSGKTYRWDKPPLVAPGRTAHPGEDFQCRCVAIPVINVERISNPRR